MGAYLVRRYKNARHQPYITSFSNIAVLKRGEVWGQVLCPSPMPYALCPMPMPMPYAYALCPMPYALCPMPYALCPMPYALCPMPARAHHVTEKGYSCTFTTKKTQTSVRLK